MIVHFLVGIKTSRGSSSFKYGLGGPGFYLRNRHECCDSACIVVTGFSTWKHFSLSNRHGCIALLIFQMPGRRKGRVAAKKLATHMVVSSSAQRFSLQIFWVSALSRLTPAIVIALLPAMASIFHHQYISKEVSLLRVPDENTNTTTIHSFPWELISF